MPLIILSDIVRVKKNCGDRGAAGLERPAAYVAVQNVPEAGTSACIGGHPRKDIALVANSVG
jgi:hypothetical protein